MLIYDQVRHYRYLFGSLTILVAPLTRRLIPTFILFLKILTRKSILVKRKKNLPGKRTVYIAIFTHLQMEYNVRNTPKTW